MKQFLALLVLVPFAALAQTRPPEDAMRTQFDRLWNRTYYPLVKPEQPNQIKGKRVVYSGIAVQLVKTDRPWQLINPFAPPEYGPAEQNTTRNPINGRMSGLKFFSVSF
jgi:hypothetical protein